MIMAFCVIGGLIAFLFAGFTGLFTIICVGLIWYFIDKYNAKNNDCVYNRKKIVENELNKHKPFGEGDTGHIIDLEVTGFDKLDIPQDAKERLVSIECAIQNVMCKLGNVYLRVNWDDIKECGDVSIRDLPSIYPYFSAIERVVNINNDMLFYGSTFRIDDIGVYREITMHEWAKKTDHTVKKIYYATFNKDWSLSFIMDPKVRFGHNDVSWRFLIMSNENIYEEAYRLGYTGLIIKELPTNKQKPFRGVTTYKYGYPKQSKFFDSRTFEDENGKECVSHDGIPHLYVIIKDFGNYNIMKLAKYKM